MINNINGQINNLWQLIILLILPFTFLILVTKINFILTTNCQKKSQQKDLLEEKSLIYEKILLITFQVLIMILCTKVTTLFWKQLVPFLSLIFFLQFIISFILLFKNDKKNKLAKNPLNFGFIVLIILIFGQFLIISWKLHHLLFTNVNYFILITTIYITFILFICRLFNQNLLVIRYLISQTYRILITKKNDKLTKVKQSLTIYSKTRAITNLWDFVNWKNNHNPELNNNPKDKQVIKNQFILFIIAWINLANKNITKLQKIIINGWKISLTE